MADLKRDYTIVIVTHNMQQAARVSDMTAFMTTDVDDDGRPSRATGRVRRDREDLHEPVRPAHGGLHHRSVRMSGSAGDRCRDGRGSTMTVAAASSSRSSAGCVAIVAGVPRRAVCAASCDGRAKRARRCTGRRAARRVAVEQAKQDADDRVGAAEAVAALAAGCARRGDRRRSWSSTGSAGRSCATPPARHFNGARHGEVLAEDALAELLHAGARRTQSPSGSSSSTVRRARCCSCSRSRCDATARWSARSRSPATSRRRAASRACAATSSPT